MRAPVEYWYRHPITSNQNQDESDTTPPPFLVCKSKFKYQLKSLSKKNIQGGNDKAIANNLIKKELQKSG